MNPKRLSIFMNLSLQAQRASEISQWNGEASKQDGVNADKGVMLQLLRAPKEHKSAVPDGIKPLSGQLIVDAILKPVTAQHRAPFGVGEPRADWRVATVAAMPKCGSKQKDNS